MSVLIILSITILVVASSHCLQLLVRKFRNLPPSPYSLPILGHLHHFKVPLHQSLRETSDKVGPITLLRFGQLQVLHVMSPSAAEECLRLNDVVFANRPCLLTGDVFGYNSRTLIWAPYGHVWRDLRRISTIHMLSPHSQQLAAGMRREEVRSLLRRITQEAERENLTVEIGDALFEMTHKMAMRFLVKEGYKGEEMKRFIRVLKEVMRIEGTATIVDVLPWLRFFGVKWRLKEKFRVLVVEKEKFLDDLLEKNKNCETMTEGDDVDSGISSNEVRKGLIQVLLSLQKSEPEFYTNEMIKGLIQVLLLAGTDTTGGTLEWALSLMLNNPMVLKKAQHEIASQIGFHRLIEESDLAHLTYLRRIINETLRLYPAAPLLIPHQSAQKSVIGGYTIPPGTILFVNAWAIHYNPKYWANPEEFRPERFEGIEKDDEQIKYKFIPFGSGRRSCPGEGMAMRTVGLTLGALLQCFDWERTGPELVDMGFQNGLSVPKAQRLRAKCQPRKSMTKYVSQI